MTPVPKESLTVVSFRIMCYLEPHSIHAQQIALYCLSISNMCILLACNFKYKLAKQ